MGTAVDLGPDCLWVVSALEGGTDRRAYYPWDAAALASDHGDEPWLSEALAHLAAIEGEGGFG